MSMDIYAKPGSKIRFSGKNGHDHEQEYARTVLTVGKEYIVEGVEVGGWSSTVRLVGHEQGFNTVMFDDVVSVRGMLLDLRSDLVSQAEKLKEELWGFLDEIGEPPFKIRETMNNLLDEIESLEFDDKEKK